MKDISLQRLVQKYIREKNLHNSLENGYLKEDLNFRESKVNMLHNLLLSLQGKNKVIKFIYSEI